MKTQQHFEITIQPYYFTYGADEHFPFQDGWTIVYAQNLTEAIDIFRAYHPDRHPGVVNCAEVYDAKDFVKTDMYKKGNFDFFGHELIQSYHVIWDGTEGTKGFGALDYVFTNRDYERKNK